MSNLTKYDILKHRHLSLLKVLEEQGVTAHFSQTDGQWHVKKVIGNQPAPRGFIVSGLTNKQLAQRLMEAGTDDATEVRDRLNCLLGNADTEYLAYLRDAVTEAGYEIKHAPGSLGDSNFRIEAKDFQRIADKLGVRAGEMLNAVCYTMGISLWSDGTWRNTGGKDATRVSLGKWLSKDEMRKIETGNPSATICYMGTVQGDDKFDLNRIVQTYHSQDKWVLNVSGDVSFRQEAHTNLPWWVREWKAEMRNPDPFKSYTFDLHEVFDTKMEFTINDDELRARISSVMYQRKLTPVLRDLLRAVRTAIVEPSPAKVD